MEKIDVKALDVKPTFEAAKIDARENGPKRPKDDVKVGNLGSGSAAPATVVAPLNKVQTGGFGDPNGLPGKGRPESCGEREPSGVLRRSPLAKATGMAPEEKKEFAARWRAQNLETGLPFHPRVLGQKRER